MAKKVSMRELKFRAWDNSWKKKLMIYFGLFDLDDGAYCKDGVTDLRGAEIMQYTDLKDKNGKEIYEGDILQSYYRCSKTNELRLGAKKKKVVEWREVHNATGWNIAASAKNNDVIGNIYENPELLNDTS